LKRLAFVFVLFATVFYSQVPAPPNAQGPKGTITGAVTRITTGTPIARATVTLTRVNAPVNPLGPQGQPFGQQQQQPQQQPPQAQNQMQQPGNITVQTDQEGKFQFKDVDAGSYRLTVARNGFARQEYGQRALNRPGTMLERDSS
jgi:hypothetical protein